MTQRQDKRKRSWISNNIASPYGLAAISYAFFLFACLIPPSFYSHYMGEPDLMFLDPATILFYTLCVLSFAGGALLISWLFPATLTDCRYDIKISPTIFILTPLISAVIVSTIASVYLITHYPVLLLSLLSGQGGDVKNTIAFDISGRFAIIPLGLIGITWWSYWRYGAVRLNVWGRRFVKISVLVSILAMIAVSIVTLSRNTLMLGICGMMILFALKVGLKRQLNVRLVVLWGALFAIIVSLLFIGFAFLSGTVSWDEQISTLFGYTVASYNRLAAVVNGRLHYPFSGHGIYLSDIVAHSRLLRLGKTVQTPSPLDVWGSEFSAVSNAGLDDRLIWSGAFGYIFSELHWWACFFIFGYGILYGTVWTWMKRGRVAGILLYPCFGFSILFWLGSNFLLNEPLEIVICLCVILAIYEAIFVKTTIYLD